jgi:hypothetical protein
VTRGFADSMADGDLWNGALHYDLAALNGVRDGELDIDDAAFTDGLASASKTQSAGAVPHWLPNNNVKLSLGFDYSWFDGGATDGVRITDRTAESVIFSQMQLTF